MLQHHKDIPLSYKGLTQVHRLLPLTLTGPSETSGHCFIPNDGLEGKKTKDFLFFNDYLAVQMCSAAAPVQVPKRGAPSICRENKV